MTSTLLKQQEMDCKAHDDDTSFVQLSQESLKERMVASIKAEFVNVLRVRKVVHKSLS